MSESSTDPITILAAEGQLNEDGAPVPSWGSGTAPSTPMVDDEEGLVSTYARICAQEMGRC